jgi:hypothetical protein
MSRIEVLRKEQCGVEVAKKEYVVWTRKAKQPQMAPEK